MAEDPWLRVIQARLCSRLKLRALMTDIILCEGGRSPAPRSGDLPDTRHKHRGRCGCLPGSRGRFDSDRGASQPGRRCLPPPPPAPTPLLSLRASLTVKSPSAERCPLSPAIAAWASVAFGISTKPKPRGALCRDLGDSGRGRRHHRYEELRVISSVVVYARFPAKICMDYVSSRVSGAWL